MINENEKIILDFIRKSKGTTSKEIYEATLKIASYATIKRLLSKLVSNNLVIKKGNGKSTKYLISEFYEILFPINMVSYFENEIDNRTIKEYFNFNLIEQTLKEISLFTKEEIAHLEFLQNKFKENISALSEIAYKKELERLAIDLSWKSSQIEGNTYSLLETEILLKEKITATGKTKEEAIMLINHKEAIDFIIDNPDYLIPLTISKIEDIHRLLSKDLGISKNLRKRKIGISGTNYKPLETDYQISEAMIAMCDLANKKENVFEKALLVLLLISYIQPFEDGNKRTARIVSNAILLNYQHCPISYRTIDSIEYKKAMLLFYEQNNVFNFKDIFIKQFEFAVKTYF